MILRQTDHFRRREQTAIRIVHDHRLGNPGRVGARRTGADNICIRVIRVICGHATSRNRKSQTIWQQKQINLHDMR